MSFIARAQSGGTRAPSDGATRASACVATPDLRLEQHSCRPVRSREGLARESTDVKLRLRRPRGDIRPAPPQCEQGGHEGFEGGFGSLGL
jgi:hypothetical protein